MNYQVMEPILQIQDVSLSFNGKPVLNKANAEVRNIVRPGVDQGQVVCLLGPSGVGKTQLFRILAGLQPIQTAKGDPVQASGQVLVSPELKPVRAGMVGVVSQHYTLFRHRTVMGNLLLATAQAGMKEEEGKARAMEYLKKFGIGDKARAYPAELSGGQRQRVAIVQQLLCSNHFLLMDEPFSGLDPLMKDEACKLILDVSMLDELNTSVITTHDISTAIVVADTIWLIGRDRDEKGNSLGARIQKVYDLAAMGLAWDPDIRNKPEFVQLAREIRQDFARL